LTGMVEIESRVRNLEKTSEEQVLTLVELLSNLTFFGELKRSGCVYLKEGQCARFSLQEFEEKLPMVSRCRIRDCKATAQHYHLEISNICCGLCQEANRDKPESFSASLLLKNEKQEIPNNKPQKNR